MKEHTAWKADRMRLECSDHLVDQTTDAKDKRRKGIEPKRVTTDHDVARKQVYRHLVWGPVPNASVKVGMSASRESDISLIKSCTTAIRQWKAT